MSNLDQRAITEAHELGVWVGNRWNVLWRAQAIAARKREIREELEMEEFWANHDAYFSRFA